MAITNSVKRSLTTSSIEATSKTQQGTANAPVAKATSNQLCTLADASAPHGSTTMWDSTFLCMCLLYTLAGWGTTSCVM
eukprot:4722811-Amphidinium_carterae.1